MAGIGRPQNRNRIAIAQALATRRIRNKAAKLFVQKPQRRRQGSDQPARHVAFIGEIDFGFGLGAQAQNRHAQLLHHTAKRAAELAQGLARLGARLGRNQIGQGFDLRQVQLPGRISAARKLAGFGQTQPGQPAKYGQNRFDHRARSVDMQLRHIFARETARPGKPQNHTIVQPLAVCRIA